MATKQTSFVHVDEHYIHMEIISSPNNFSYNREFEFQITSVSNEKETSSSLADELFHKGKLLPLHLLNSSVNAFTTDLRVPSSNAIISPSESACMSITEVSPEVADDYLFVRKPWSKKLKQIKQLWVGQRLKASGGSYVKSWFRKYGCSDKSFASNQATERKWKNPFQIVDDKRHKIFRKTINRDKKEDAYGGMNKHRRSFSGATRHSATKASCGSLSSSSSFSFSSSSRSSSADSERESSIEEAIAHCKQSQQKCSSSKTLDDGRICSQVASKFAIYGNQETATPEAEGQRKK